VSKPKHPTVKSLRTGQTIYQVGVNDAGGANPSAFVRQISVGGERTPYPELGDLIIEAPVDHLRDILATMPEWLRGYVFYSKRRAERFANNLTYKMIAADFERSKRQYYRENSEYLYRTVSDMAHYNGFSVRPAEEWPDLRAEFDIEELNAQAERVIGAGELLEFVDGETQEVARITDRYGVQELNLFLNLVFDGRLHEEIAIQPRYSELKHVKVSIDFQL
jgi:hypothetical protein